MAGLQAVWLGCSLAVSSEPAHLYLLCHPTPPRPVRLQRIVPGWNFGLSAFSFAGMAYCLNPLSLVVY